MPSEHDKMLAGELYNALDPELVAARERARDLLQALNATRERDVDERRRIQRELLGAGGEGVTIQPPFYCDYVTNLELGGGAGRPLLTGTVLLSFTSVNELRGFIGPIGDAFTWPRATRTTPVSASSRTTHVSVH